MIQGHLRSPREMVKSTRVPVEQEDFEAAMERFKIMEDNMVGTVFFSLW